MIIGIVSGYFNPLHQGHIEYINEAKKHCDILIVIVNNDKQVIIKGSTPFMSEDHRCVIVSNLKSVDVVIISQDEDSTVCKTIEIIKSVNEYDEFIFFNSGDRVSENADKAEIVLCKKLGIKYVDLILPKLYSSSKLIETAALEY